MLNIFIYIYIYTEYTSYIQYMLVYWRKVSVVVSRTVRKCCSTFPFFGIAMVDWQIRQAHFEYDIVRGKSPPPIPDGSVKFLVSYLIQLPHSFLCRFFFFCREKL